MTVNRENLIAALEANRIAISTHETPCYFFTGKAIESSNLDSFISVPFETDFVCNVLDKKLLAFVKGLNSETITLTYDEAESLLTVACGKIKSKFACSENAIPWPVIDEFKEMPIPPDTFALACSRCIGYVSKDQTRIVLGGVHFVTVGGTLFAEATDGRRLCRVDLGKIDDKYDFIIPAPLLHLIMREEILEFSLTDTTIAFSCKSGTLYAGRIISGVYPNVNQVIPDSTKEGYVEVVLPDTFKACIKRALLLDDSRVDLGIKKDECEISVTAKNVSYKESVPVTASGETRVVFNTAYLAQAFEMCPTMHINANSPCIGTAGNTTVVVMPLRPS
jgi:DNA polymerase III sliding clamp (beta) subunit (PCNA family)